MSKIIGNTTTTPMVRPDWAQTDETKAGYIKNKPNLEELAQKEDVQNLELELSNKIDKEEGKILSTNDYTNDDKNKLSSVEHGAQVNIQSDWSQTDETKADYIKNKPAFKFDTLLSASISENIFHLSQENDACIVSIENHILTLL